ncbi:hypothetical protein G6F56_014421 [Rhizopus delemar]|nr:hypothetical protein G6F56_014421 [Rhizopus delemar]
MLVHRTRIDHDRAAARQRAQVDGDLGAQFAQQFHRGDHVMQVRHVGDLHRRIGQQGRAENGEDGVLGAGDAYFTPASAGVTVFSASAWIAPPIRSPRVA